MCGFFVVVRFGLVWLSFYFFSQDNLSNRTWVQNIIYCFMYEKVDDNDGYIMGKKKNAVVSGGVPV